MLGDDSPIEILSVVMDHCRLADSENRQNVANTFGDAVDMVALARLSLSPNLRAISLSLTDNQVSDKGAVALLEDIQYATHLEHILMDFKRNLIGPLGISQPDVVSFCFQKTTGL
jgi:hypothetical protein